MTTETSFCLQLKSLIYNALPGEHRGGANQGVPEGGSCTCLAQRTLERGHLESN